MAVTALYVTQKQAFSFLFPFNKIRWSNKSQTIPKDITKSPVIL